MSTPLTTTVLSRALPALAVIAAAGVAGLFGLTQMRTTAERDVYRDRLRSLTGDFQQLRDQYNAAVRQTAVTELLVEDGRLSVQVRNIEGSLATVETPYDPSGEIYVDYAVLDGRIWIRRVFDMLTPPSQATVIDPRLASIDWNDPRAQMGQAVYRSFSEGRWVVTVSGNGGLGLRRAEHDEAVALSSPPPILGFDEIEAEAADAGDRVTVGDMLQRLLGGG